MIFQKFNPVEALQRQDVAKIPRWVELSQSRATKSLEELRLENAHWFAQPMAFELTAPTLWLINTELTRRGVAPQWRGVPRFVQRAPPPPADPRSKAPRRIGDVGQKNLMKRWIDLEWLRVVLGSAHVTKKKGWQDVFAEDLKRAVVAFSKVNAMQSHGGGKYGTQPAHEVMLVLSIPKFHRLGLTGLIDRDAGELVRNMEKRVRTRLRPRLELLMERPAFALTSAEVERRIMYCEAIELAVGSPTAAATLFRWMTGEAVTRQTMQEMRCKIAEQCGLTTRAWRAIRPK